MSILRNRLLSFALVSALPFGVLAPGCVAQDTSTTSQPTSCNGAAGCTSDEATLDTDDNTSDSTGAPARDDRGGDDRGGDDHGHEHHGHGHDDGGGGHDNSIQAQSDDRGGGGDDHGHEHHGHGHDDGGGHHDNSIQAPRDDRGGGGDDRGGDDHGHEHHGRGGDDGGGHR